MRERLLELLRTLRQLLRLDHVVARLAAHEAGVLEQRPVEAEERRRPLDPELGQRAQHAGDGALPVDVVDDQLRDHRVVEAAHLVPRLDPRIDPDPGARRLAIRGDPAGRGQESLRDVLRVDPALDRVPAEHHVVLADRQRLARGDEHLLPHEVEPRDRLRDGVLDLDPRVHLHEEVVALARQQPLDRARRPVSGGPRRVDGDLADPGAERVVDGGRRRLLDELLVAALDRAVALAQVDHVAVRVGEDLDLDVARVLDVSLHVHGRVREVLLPLAGGCVERALGVGRPADDLHALAAAAGRRLDDQRVADLGSQRDDLRGGGDRVDRTRDDRHAGGAHRRTGSRLRPHQLDRRRGWADPGQPGVLDESRERRVLGQEPVSGMDRLGPRAQRRLDEHVGPEVALGSRAGADEVRLVGRAHVRAPPVGLRVDGNATDPELAQRPEDPDRDLAPVGDQHLREGRHTARILPEP